MCQKMTLIFYDFKNNLLSQPDLAIKDDYVVLYFNCLHK